jgi:trk system potassium uptake protein
LAEQHKFPLRLTRQAHEGEILVVGLGRFGGAVAQTLVEMGYEVLAVDFEEALVQRYAETLTHVVQADTTNERALRQIGVADISTAVVCIGTDIESSVLTTGCLVDIGVPNIWAKAITKAHGKILDRVGAHHVVFPEADMGARVAHLLTGRTLEYVELDDDFVIAETSVPRASVGKTLGEAQIRAEYDVTVVCTKVVGSAFTYATAETVLGVNDLVVVAGRRYAVDRFINTE